MGWTHEDGRPSPPPPDGEPPEPFWGGPGGRAGALWGLALAVALVAVLSACQA